MKLYYIPASCSLSTHIVLNELGINAELIKVDYKNHTTEDGNDYFAVNSLGYVPMIELDDGTRFREGPAIVQYLADLKPELGLAPVNGSQERYRLQEMLNYLSSEIHKGFIPLLYSVLAGKYIETTKPKLEKRFAWINEHLSDRQYLMGDNFTVADAYLFALTGWGQASWLKSYYKADIHFEELSNLEAWYKRVAERPSVRKALQKEGLA